MSEELAEAGAERPPQSRRAPRRRTGRGAKGRQKSEPADAEAQTEAAENKAPAAPETDHVIDEAAAVPRFASAPPEPVEGGGEERTEVTALVEEKARATEQGVDEEKRRPRRRTSRSRTRPTRAPGPEEGEPDGRVAPAPIPVPASPEPDAEPEPATVPGRAASAPDQVERTRLARRRRRGGPRRDRAGGPQPSSGPLTMLLAVGKERNQIAVLRDRELIEHYVSHDEDRSIVGNIYVGRVQNVLPGMEAAFLDIGEARNAVLYAGEVSFDEEIEGPPPRIESMLKSGQAVLAQVTKDPMGSKGARLTTEVSLAGRYLVLVPGADSLGISRRLADDERKRLRDIANRVRPRGHGLIVRTAAEGVSESDLESDVKRLIRIWSEIDEKRKKAKPPKLVYSEPDLAIRGIRDLFTSDVVRVIVEDRTIFDQIRDYLTEVAPALAERVELYDEDPPLFEKFRVVEQLRKAIDRKIWLKSGGHIVIDRTEAMTVIDVNTGRFVGKSNLETTVLHANLEAAEEIAKQLRLRDIGGIIVIDFIDMMHERNRQELVKTFEAALQRDKTRTQVFNISELGLLQMTRKNVSEGLLEAFSHVCETCDGRGIILTDLD